jgi:two-component system, OmpR family, response regulator
MKKMLSSVNDADIVIVDNDPRVLFSLDYLFSIICKMDVCLATEISVAEGALEDNSALGLLIVGLSGGDSERTALIEKATGRQNPPFILVVDGNENPARRIEAYLSGADDVIRKPFSLLELYLRLKTRTAVFSFCPEIVSDFAQGNWDTEAFLAKKAGLTTSEAQIAHVLIERRGKVVSRNELSIAINGSPWEFGDRKFDVHVSSLRKKLDASLAGKCRVTTVHSIGYTLTMDGTFA